MSSFNGWLKQEYPDIWKVLVGHHMIEYDERKTLMIECLPRFQPCLEQMRKLEDNIFMQEHYEKFLDAVFFLMTCTRNPNNIRFLKTLLWIVIKNILQNKMPFKLYGEQFPTQKSGFAVKLPDTTPQPIQELFDDVRTVPDNSHFALHCLLKNWHDLLQTKLTRYNTPEPIFHGAGAGVGEGTFSDSQQDKIKNCSAKLEKVSALKSEYANLRNILMNSPHEKHQMLCQKMVVHIVDCVNNIISLTQSD